MSAQGATTHRECCQWTSGLNTQRWTKFVREYRGGGALEGIRVPLGAMRVEEGAEGVLSNASRQPQRPDPLPRNDACPLPCPVQTPNP